MNLSTSYSRGLALVLISAIAYGGQPLFASQAYASEANPVGLLLSRFILASLMLWGWLVLRRVQLPTLQQAVPALLTGIGYGGAALGYYNAIHSSTVSLAVVLMFSFPAFVVAFSALFLKTPLTRPRLLALALALSGVLMASGSDLDGDITGISWALFASLSYGSAILYGSHNLPARGSLGSAAVILLGCMIPFILALPWQPPQWPQTAAGWQAVSALALFCTIVPIATFIAGAAIIGASDAATLSTLEPVVAVILAVTLLGEPLHNATLTGGLMVITAAVILARKPSEKPASSELSVHSENGAG